MNYESLLIPPSQEKKREKLVQINTRKAPVKKASQKMLERGCDFCPSNAKKGINKIKGKVRGRDIFIWGMAPGRDENKAEKEFVGRSGKFLWDELSRVGIKRIDCDIQNVVRCFPADKEDGMLIQRDPSKEEYHCCSKYTDRALAKSKAKIYIVLGTKAGEQLLGKDYKKTRRVFWSEKLKAKVYCLYHPSYFVRGVYPKEVLKEFRDSLDQIASDFKIKGGPSKYGFLGQQDYEAITTIKRAIEVKKELLEAAREKGTRASIDLEEDEVDGKRIDLCVGFSNKVGTARVFITGHPKVKKVNGKWVGLSSKVVRKMRRIVTSLIEDKRLEKIAHHGCYDAPAFERLLEAKMLGFNFDTEFSSYLARPDQKSFGLAAIAQRSFPQFIDYKQIIMPYAFPKNVDEALLKEKKVDLTSPASMYQFCKKTGSMRLAQLPLKILTLYNGADNDLTKRIEVATRKHVHLPLLRIYTDASFILAKMEPNGPAFDFDHHAKLQKLLPVLLEQCYDKIKQIAGQTCRAKVRNKKTGEIERKEFWNTKEGKEFNPGSPPQVAALLYRKLSIRFPGASADKHGNPINPGTGKKILEILQLKYPVARLIAEYRRLSKMVSTYLDSYAECAKNNGGLLRTSWWLTGTSTGRMSSGGGRGDDKGVTKQINLQNIHGDENLKNQIVADPEWRKLYVAIRKAVRKAIGTSELDSIKDCNAAIARLPSVGFKEKKKKLEDNLYAAKSKLVEKLSKSLRFKKLCRAILAGALGATMVLLGFDQGQVEVRVMAQASGDKNLIKDCKSGDIHSKVGHAMTGWSIEKIKHDKKTRTLTKNVHFGIMFGLVPEGLLDFIRAKDPETDLTIERVKELYDNYFRRYSGVRRFMLKMRAFVEEHGFVENMFGFVRPLNTEARTPMGDMFGDEEEHQGGAYWGNQAINCVDFATEALTQRGWIKGYNLKVGDVLLTKNAKTNKLEWQSTTDVKVFPNYNKKLMLFKSRSFNAASTLDHRWLTGHGKEYVTSEITQDKHIHRTGNYDGPARSMYPDDVVRLAGWYLTDGYSRKKGGWYGGHGFGLCQSNIGNPKKVKMIDALCERLRNEHGFKIRTKLKKNRKDGEVFWYVSGGLASHLHGLFPNRTLTPQFLSTLTKSQLEILLHIMVLGDGWGSKLSKLRSNNVSGKRHDKISFCSGNKKQISMFQMLCMLTGRACNILKRDMSKYKATQKKYESMGNKPKLGVIWTANILRRKVAHVYPHHKRMIKNTGVWCPMVPNTFFVARRKGQVFVTGNTPIQGAAHCLMFMAMAIMKRNPKKYKKLIPTLEVHDYMGFKAEIRSIFKLFALGKNLLEKQPLKLIKREYPKIKWKIPLVVEGNVGFRYGDSVEADGKKMHELLAEMFSETFTKESKLDCDLELVA